MGLSDLTSLSNQTREETTCFGELKRLRLNYPRNVIPSYININSIRNICSGFSEMIGDFVDVLIIAETKIDSCFPKNQFTINGFKCPYRLDVSGNSVGILVYVRDGLLSKSLGLVGTRPDIQVLPIEINDRKQKWSMLPIYRPPQQNSGYFIEKISN